MRSVNWKSRPCFSAACGWRKREQSIGVSVSEMKPLTKIATPITTANSLSNRPRIPPMNSTGMNTAASEIVIETIVNPISREPFSAASIGDIPFSRWRTIFSSTTIASSTTKPVASVIASSEKLSTLKLSRCMTMNVPMIESGIAIDGMSVARTLRRKRKITITTSAMARTSVNSTSSTLLRIVMDLSASTSSCTAGGICERMVGSSAFTASTTATVLAPGCFWMASTIPRVLPNQLAILLFSTLSITRPSCSRRTGEPLRYATIRFR